MKINNKTMSGAETARYDDEIEYTSKFDEMINAIDAMMYNADIGKGIRIIKTATRAFFLDLGYNKIKITDNEQSSKIIVEGDANIISELPGQSREFQINNGVLAVGLVDEKILIYKKIEGDKWMVISTCEASA